MRNNFRGLGDNNQGGNPFFFFLLKRRRGINSIYIDLVSLRCMRPADQTVNSQRKGKSHEFNFAYLSHESINPDSDLEQGVLVAGQRRVKDESAGRYSVLRDTRFAAL